MKAGAAAAAAAAEAAGRVCARVGRRLGSSGSSSGSACGGSGPSGAAAARTPAAAGEAQPGLRTPWSRRGPGTGDPSGNPEPDRVGWVGARTLGRSCSHPAAAGRGLRPTPDRGSGSPPLAGDRVSPLSPQALKCLLPLPGAHSAWGQSCGRVLIAEPGRCRDPAGSARSRSAADIPAPPPPRPPSRTPLETAS